MIVCFFWVIYFDKEFVYKALKINIIFCLKFVQKMLFFLSFSINFCYYNYTINERIFSKLRAFVG